MKYSCQNLVSQYTRQSTYTPTHYTPSHYTPKQYSTSSYSTSHYSSAKYTPTYYTPPAYTPAYKSTSSSYTSVYNKPSGHVGKHGTLVEQTPVATGKPNRTVRFTNDVLFQDYVRHGDLEKIGRFMRARKVQWIQSSILAWQLSMRLFSQGTWSVKLLIKYGADVHQRDEDGWTPLHMACSDGYPEIARYLLSLGASTEAENSNGEKPADLIDTNCKELVKLFQMGCV